MRVSPRENLPRSSEAQKKKKRVDPYLADLKPTMLPPSEERHQCRYGEERQTRIRVTASRMNAASEVGELLVWKMKDDEKFRKLRRQLNSRALGR